MDHSLFFVKKEISLERQVNTDLALKKSIISMGSRLNDCIIIIRSESMIH
jgi:hypothetical protein